MDIYKRYSLNFKSTQDSFFYFFCFSMYKMFDSMGIFGIIMKNSEMLEFAPDHLKTKNLRKHALKKLAYLL